MSNSIGIYHTLIEHQPRINTTFHCVSPNYILYPPQLTSNLRKPPLFTKFSFNVRRKRWIMSSNYRNSVMTRAVLATDSPSELGGKFNLEGNTELQVNVRASSPGCLPQIELQVTNSRDNLVIHWAGVRDKNGEWVLPSRHPDGTKVFNNQALRTPFVKSGSTSFLRLEIDDPVIQAIEFLIFDESRNKWFKHNGNNFHIKLPSPNISVPEELVQIQAYLRWERNGKQMYTPEQEKKEFEEARKELLSELEKGISVENIRNKITKGEIKTKVSKQPEKKKFLTAERIKRKKRDLMQLLNKFTPVPVKETISAKPPNLSAIALFAKAKEEQSGGPVLRKNVYKLADKELVVLVTKLSGKTMIDFATDFEDPLTLHWALSENPGEWLAPPSTTLPTGSILLDKAVETRFSSDPAGDKNYTIQSIKIETEENFAGMPFVLLSGENWIKNNGSDFYVDLSSARKQIQKDAGDGKGTSKSLLDKIAEMESEAQKSFMHRFNIAADLIEEAKDAGELGLVAILVWMRFMATRQLIWNKNYNVKPREISKAQDRLIDLLQNVYKNHPEYRELLRMILSTVGRGGEGDVGQRIRDEILVIQSKNDCKGGIMEQWHQKLHNNTSPDDVVICQALIDYIKSDFDVNIYWRTLNENGITKERLLSYDRAIRSEPSFRRDQKDGLLRDLGSYMRTLKAVHSGADLESAISNCMGYKSEGQGFMVGVQINPVSGLPSGIPELFHFILAHVEDKNVEALLEGLLEARVELRPLISNPNDRLKDLLFLDIALVSTVRTTIERAYEELNSAKPEKVMYFITLLLENLALSSDDNENLIYCLKGWNQAISMLTSGDNHWALYAKSVLDRT